MRYTFASEHHHFFNKEQYICFEGLLPPNQMQSLKNPVKGLTMIPTPFERYLAGRDLFRHDRALRSTILRAQWGEIATVLFKQKPLRLAYTQYIYGITPLEEALPLKSISSFTHISGAFIVNLLSGEAAFLSNDCPLSKTGWLGQDSELLCIVYMHPESRYSLISGDPCVHALKKLGYGFGDTLENETHPIVRS